MKKYLVPLIIALLPITSQAQDVSTYNKLLKKYASADGVHYKKWAANKNDHKALEKVLDDWSKVDANQLSKPKKAAFRINLYNAAMMNVVLDKYPIESVTKIGLINFSIFDKKIIKTPTGKISLNTLEKKRLLIDFPDARVHFAVNCASVSCPPLRDEAYDGDKLDKQLNEQSVQFANSSRAAQIHGNTVKYSELFKWYAKDFGTKNPAVYLNKFRTKKINTKSKVAWIDYNWNLNAAN